MTAPWEIAAQKNMTEEGQTREKMPWEIASEQGGEPFVEQASYPEQKEAMQSRAAAGSMMSRTISNYPESVSGVIKDYAKGIYETARHPIDTLDTIMIGAAKNLIAPALGLIQEKTGLGDSAVGEYKSAKEQFLKSRYGSLENFAKYVEEDPARAQLDIVGVLTGGGKAIQAAGKATNIPFITKSGKVVMEAGAFGEPMTMPIKALGSAYGKLIPSRVAEKLYNSTAKMTKVMDPIKRQALGKKLLDAEVSLSLRSFRKLSEDFEFLWRSVDQKIDDYVAKGANKKATVMDMLDGIDEWEDRAKLTGRSAAVKRIKNQMINDLTDTFVMDGEKVRLLRRLDAKELNTAKRRIYRELYSQYGKEMVPLAAEIKMGIAHNTMRIIEDMIPGIIPDNKTAAAYKELMDLIKNGVNRIEDRDIIGLGFPVRMGQTAMIAEKWGVPERMSGLLGLAAGIADLPSVKSWTAIRLNRLNKMGVTLSPTKTAIKLGMVKAGEYLDRQEDEVMQ
jgi:hypothetical protein